MASAGAYDLLYLTLILCFLRAYSSPSLFVVGPNVIRYSVDETVMVTLFDANRDTDVEVFLQDYPSRTRSLSLKRLKMKKDVHELITVRLEPGDLPKSEAKKRYVYLVAKSASPAYKFHKETLILVNPNSGYIFIQTDKPLYTPTQTVKMRIIPLDENMFATKWPVQIDIKNPNGTIVSRDNNQMANEGFIVDSFQFPPKPVMGNWTITARYQNSLDTETSVQVEVRKYVLPTFSVTILSKPYFLMEEDGVNAIVQAEYVYKKRVQGHVDCEFSVIHDGQQHPIAKISVVLKNGVGICYIQSQDIQDMAPQIWFPDGGRIMLEATVHEQATGNKEMAVDTSCVIARSPYIFKFTRSQKYFKPSLPYDVKVDVFYVNGKPAPGVTLEVTATAVMNNGVERPLAKAAGDQGFNEVQSDPDGHLRYTYDLIHNMETLNIRVQTKDKDIKVQSVGTMSVGAYQSPSKSFLLIRILSETAKVNTIFQASVVATDHKSVKAFNVLVMSKGKIVHNEIIAREVGVITTVQFQVSVDMVPSARLVVFYVRQDKEIVADSTWFDVENTCADELTVKSNKLNYEPEDYGKITITGRPNSMAGLLVVDKAVYLLNNQHRLTRDLMFQTMDNHDMGCGTGSGKNSAGVFFDSGLSAISESLNNFPKQTSFDCEEKSRRKRDTALLTIDASSYHRKFCCQQGESLVRTERCAQGANALVNATVICRSVFYKCCNLNRLRKGRSGQEPNKELNFNGPDAANAVQIIRTKFPESWFFETVKINPHGKTEKTMNVPHSITNWVLQAVSVSDNSPMCVAPASNFTAFKKIFIQLDLPYSAVRMEQIEVRATIFNYATRRKLVHLFMEGVEGICSLARPGKRSPRQSFNVEANSAYTAVFSIVPLKVGTFPIRVEAYVDFSGDIIVKNLLVENEGMLQTRTRTIVLDPLKTKALGDRMLQDASQIDAEDLTLPPEAIPGTGSCSISFVGTLMGPTIKTVITGLENKLATPIGCGEQTIIRMAPTVYAMLYMQQTKQITAAIEKRGHKLIKDGYQRELLFRKRDGSFATWAHLPSSTWLTAFVLKVYCQAKEFTYIPPDVTCTGLEWLTKQQNKKTGAFTEKQWVFHKEMTGGINDDASMTAFVLITLLECDCPSESRDEPTRKAITFLETQLKHVDRPYVVALTAYALALANSPKKLDAKNKLMQLSIYNAETDTRHWGVGDADDFKNQKKPYWYRKKPNAVAVETTSYALLTYLQYHDIDASYPIVRWLTQQRKTDGSFVSTQDTVIGLQSMAQYMIKSYAAELDQKCKVTSEADGNFNRDLVLNMENALEQQTIYNVPIGGKVFVDTTGTGVGQMTIELNYNIATSEEETCKFDMEIISEELEIEIPDANGAGCDVCGQECDGAIQEVLPFEEDYELGVAVPRMNNGRINRMGARRGRIGQQVGRQGAQVHKLICIEVCARYLGDKSTGMAIYDVGLFTGFEPKIEDLELLVMQKKIQQFEKYSRRVVLYLEQISHEEHLCVKFRAKQQDRIENIQPVHVKVYDYYEPDVSCTKFYKPGALSGKLYTVCFGRICQCAEGMCCACQDEEDRLAAMDYDLLLDQACQKMDYVIFIRVTSVENENSLDKITGMVRIVAKPGTEEMLPGDERIFWKRDSCRCPQFETGKTYFIMGKDGHPVKGEDGVTNYRYSIDDDSFVMEYSKVKNDDSDAKKEAIKIIRRLTRVLTNGGCPL